MTLFILRVLNLQFEVLVIDPLHYFLIIVIIISLPIKYKRFLRINFSLSQEIIHFIFILALY